MARSVAVKICGLTDAVAVDAAVQAGARYLGFVFFPRSPRHLDHETAALLAARVPAGIAKVALTVDADDAALDALVRAVPLDILQLHGHECPARVAQIKMRFGLPVMKAIGIATAADLALVADYATVADQLLIDAKPSEAGDLPGGNGLAFDWRLIAGFDWPCPWMLAGGLTPATVSDAIRLTGARQVDVSSGVESAPGVKDPARMAQFIQAAQAAGGTGCVTGPGLPAAS